MTVTTSGSSTRLFDEAVAVSRCKTPAISIPTKLVDITGYPVLQMRSDSNLAHDRQIICNRLSTRVSNETIINLCRAIADHVSEREFRQLLVTYLYDTVILSTRPAHGTIDVNSNVLDLILHAPTWNPIAMVRSWYAKRQTGLQKQDILAIMSLTMYTGLVTWIREISTHLSDSIDSILVRWPSIDNIIRVQHKQLEINGKRYAPGHVWIFQLAKMVRATGDSQYVFQAGPGGVQRRCPFEDFARDLLVRLQTELQNMQIRGINIAWNPRPDDPSTRTLVHYLPMTRTIVSIPSNTVWKYVLGYALTREILGRKLWTPLQSLREPEPVRCPERLRYRSDHGTSLVCPYASWVDATCNKPQCRTHTWDDHPTAQSGWSTYRWPYTTIS